MSTAVTPSGASDRQLAVSVLMPGFDGTQVPSWLEQPLREGLGGVCLFAVNTPDLATTRRLTDALRALAPQLLVTVDEEGGDVTRLQRIAGSDLPGNAALGVVNDLELTRAVGQGIGRLCRAAGIDLTLAPDVDVASNRLNPVIGVRSFGPDPALVTAHGRALLEGLHQAGVGGCTKHYPGHGDTATDSHHAVPVIDVDTETLRRRDLPPFVDTMDVADAIMIGHVVVPALGPDPATVSPWTYAMIREQGFTGLTVTDAIDMEAVRAGDATHPAGIGEATVRALEAGVDLVCLGSPLKGRSEQNWLDSVLAVEQAIASGRLDRDALAVSAARVRQARAAAQQRADGPDPTPEQAEQGLDELGRSIARRALATSGDVRADAGVAFVDLRVTLNQASGSIGSVVRDELDAARADLGLDPVVPITVDQLDAHREAQIVVLTREALAPGHERDDLAQILLARPDAVVIHAGMAQAAPQAERLILTHGLGRPNGRAAAEALLGREVVR